VWREMGALLCSRWCGPRSSSNPAALCLRAELGQGSAQASPLLLASRPPEYPTAHKHLHASREKLGEKHWQQWPLCKPKHRSVWVVSEMVWSCQNAAVGKGDARQHLAAADNSDENRPRLCAEKILAAAVPDNYFG